MAVINNANTAHVTGRLKREPHFFAAGKDNSRNVAITVRYAANNGKDTREVELLGHVPPTKDGEVNQESVYSLMVRGSRVEIYYEPNTKRYTDASGKTVYTMVNDVVRGGVELLDTKAETEALRERNAAADTKRAEKAQTATAEPSAPVAQATAPAAAVDPLA